MIKRMPVIVVLILVFAVFGCFGLMLMQPSAPVVSENPGVICEPEACVQMSPVMPCLSCPKRDRVTQRHVAAGKSYSASVGSS